MSRREVKKGHTRKAKKDEELFVFGYASKLFRDDKAADFHDKEKHLIPWQGDNSLQIDRYDCRLLFTERFQFETNPDEISHILSPEEEEIEQMCDEERYLELTVNMEEHDIEQEEEMKRFKKAISQDDSYSSVGFSYDTSNQIQGLECQPVEKFVAPIELEVPDGMEIPDTAKMNAIIEKTALFVSEQGTQMEILVKAKQAGNPQFDFLNFDNWLNPYYKHVLKRITQKIYTPQIQAVPSPQPEEAKESEPESDEEDSDGEFELHPLLTASHRSTSNTPNSSAPSSPAPHSTEQQTRHSYATGQTDEHVTYPGYDNTDYAGYQWSQQDQANYYGSEYVPVSSQYLPVPSSSTSTLSALNLLPPPPPPPGEGPLEDEWPRSGSSEGQPLYTHPSSTSISTGYGHPIVSGHPSTTSISTSYGHPIVTGHPAIMSTPIVPPPPDIQPIIDKLANYVAKNGPDFENIIKGKSDPRFTFVHPWNEHHKYYLYKKKFCIEEIERERAAALAKGPISFSIKPKEVQKPKIEYRTNVIYKQSVDPGESEDEEMKGSEVEENENGNETENKEEEDKKESQVFQTEGESQQDFEDQMKSIQAAQQEAQRLEAESQYQREKQLQEERRRKASLFISMLKKTKVTDGTSQDEEQSKNTQSKRRFTERKRPSDTSLDMFEDNKKPCEDVTASGVGAPPADIIRISQDLMAKVRAASRTNR